MPDATNKDAVYLKSLDAQIRALDVQLSVLDDSKPKKLIDVCDEINIDFPIDRHSAIKIIFMLTANQHVKHVT